MALIEPLRFPLRAGRECLIRCAQEPDAAPLLDHQRYMRDTDPFTTRTPQDPDRTLDEQRASIVKHRDHESQILLLVVLKDPRESDPPGGLIGVLRFGAGERRRVAHAGHFGISVHADWRGRGLGSRLITIMLDWAAAHHEIEKVCLGVLAGNLQARALYERIGFAFESLSPRHFKFGPNLYQDDIQMAIYVKPGIAPKGFKTWPLPPASNAASASTR